MLRRHLFNPFRPPAVSPSPYADRGSRKALDQRLQTVLFDIEAEYEFCTFDLQSFSQWVQQKRKRPIDFAPLHFPATISGAWLQLPERDLVFYEANTPPVHQSHIQLHEMSHMLCGHAPDAMQGLTEREVLKRLFAYLVDLVENPKLVNKTIGPLLLRSSRSASEEIEAEYLSALIRERITNRQFEAMITQPVTFSKVAVDFYEATGMA